MRRKRNRILKRLVLGFAVAALVVPSTAMARFDEGISGQPNSATEVSKATAYNIENVRLNPRGTSSTQVVKAGDFGMPRAMPNDYALARGDAIEVARLNPRNVVTADIENVRLAPRSVSTPQAVASSSFDWGDAGIGAALVFGLVLIGGAAVYATRHLGKAQTA